MNQRYIRLDQDETLQTAVETIQEAIELLRRLGFIAELAGHSDQCVNAINMTHRLRDSANSIRPFILKQPEQNRATPRKQTP